MSDHTVGLARLAGFWLLLIASVFGVLLFRLATPVSKWALGFLALLFVLGVLLIAGKQLVPYAVRLITAWKGAPKP